jgi:hypothetical protein
MQSGEEFRIFIRPTLSLRDHSRRSREGVAISIYAFIFSPVILNRSPERIEEEEFRIFIRPNCHCETIHGEALKAWQSLSMLLSFPPSF